ncbi:LON peptidase substrate-binding domain-containing protein [Flavimarina sp. Hel_I_48]|uniref:LON peptidase substrate-binding domain-containing protein n=1 Tax=Flavimarina sp. Hel_I_48 TaxID=1392488 RepID=UPI0004DF8F40|nr:LON peptidase substrate-binding domain-containing protein [Flavimarina sp. Hel_I_48]
MNTTLALFPLEMVVFPTEKLALHIFEARYQQLIQDCIEEEMTFGIPAFINKEMRYGTEVKLVEVVKRYPSGASDVICEGLRSFTVKSFTPTLGEKLYAGGKVRFLSNNDDGTASQRLRFYTLVKNLYDALDVVLPEFDPGLVTSYSFAHKIGLSLEQELKMLNMTEESDRFAFLIDHLSVTVPVIQQINKTKELIQLNGHFKNFDPLDFADYKIQDE